MKRQILLRQLASQPWAMDQAHLANMASILHRWSAGEAASEDVMQSVQAAKDARTTRKATAANMSGGIAVLPLYGVMSQRASMVDDISGGGGTSTQAFTSALRSALADDTVGGIIIDIDSPGGSVFGAGELAAEIFNARGQKPIYGYVNSLCASGAYWTGSQCAQLFMTPGGQAGSIGVYMQHVDESAALEMEGYKCNFISAGKYKVEGNSMGPLDDEARAFLQSQVDAYYASFTGAVAKGRGAPIGSVRGGMGQGRCLLAADALAAGMVDGICSFDDVVAKMSKAIKSGNAGARPTTNRQSAMGTSITTRANMRQRELEIAIAGSTGVKASGSTETAKIAAARRKRQIELASLNP